MMMQHHDETSFEETHEINVTPFIDVMLVLLIIFMVAAPLSTVMLPVELPSVTSTASETEDEDITLTLDAALTLFINEQEVLRDNFLLAMEAATGNDKNKRIYVQADRTVEYGDLMDLLNELRAFGYLKIALVGLEDGGRD